MYFDSLNAILVMEGHGVYVWAAYAMTVLVIGAALLAPGRRRRRLLAELAAQQKRAEGPREEGG